MGDPLPAISETATLRRDLITAYLASGSKLASWVVALAIVYRLSGPKAFALLALIRSTIGILNYTSLGIGPALIHHLARLRDQVIEFRRIFMTAVATSLAIVGLGLIGLFLIAGASSQIFHAPEQLKPLLAPLILLLGAGLLVRILSEPAGALLQTSGRIALDNLLLVIADTVWIVLLLFLIAFHVRSVLIDVGAAYLIANTFLLIARGITSRRHLPSGLRGLSLSLSAGVILLKFGVLVTIAQLADYLYAPTDFLLINHLLGPTREIAAYAPAVQIDAGLLVLVSAVASVLLPCAAIAHAANNQASIRRYYLYGTLATTIILSLAACLMIFFGHFILQAWLGGVPEGALQILPWVMIHTVVGGSSGAGRAILLGMGKVRAFTAAVVIAGIANVLLSYCFVQYFHLGLFGIVLGTIIVVVARCALWMPWYVLRILRPSLV